MNKSSSDPGRLLLSKVLCYVSHLESGIVASRRNVVRGLPFIAETILNLKEVGTVANGAKSHNIRISSYSQMTLRHFAASGSLDPPLEEALRHVFDNPGSLVRPQMVYLIATSYGLEDAVARI